MKIRLFVFRRFCELNVWSYSHEHLTLHNTEGVPVDAEDRLMLEKLFT